MAIGFSSLSSLSAQRFLNKASNDLGRSFERLSSGMRINRASDDAAGMAIADAMGAQKRLSYIAQRNISDGVSALQIAGSAIQTQMDMLTRMRELAEQSANGVYGNSQRLSLDREYQSLLKEFNRTADTTTFNNIKLLSSRRSGNPNSLGFQVGLNGGASSQVSINTSDTGVMSGTLNITQLLSSGAQDGFLDIADYSEFSNNGNTLSGYKTVHIQQVVDSNGVRREVALIALDYEDVDASTRVLGFGMVTRREGETAWSFVTTDNTVSGDTMPGNLGLGVNFNISNGRAQNATSNVTITMTDGSTANLTYDFSALQLTTDSSQTSAIDFTTVSNSQSALNSMSVLQKRAEELSSIMGEIGAFMSRLSAANNVMANFGINTAAAESRIRDVDIAEESSVLIKNQILQQAASSILAQANKQPSLVLDLLRNV